jgi:hypothetical protein
MVCHDGLKTPSGEDVSIGASWRASMMANSSRDPYWQAGVRRETVDHPAAATAIQDECATCHMPMSRTEARADGKDGEVFRHVPAGRGSGRGVPNALSGDRADRLAHDGVSCSLCHQITDQNLGTPASFTGGYVVYPPSPAPAGRPVEPRPMFGPFKIEKGLSTIMRSVTDFEPTEAAHIRQSELCATCHTLITKALGPKGEAVGELPEQVTYLEWKHSAFEGERRSCQSCHMPAVEEDTPIASVLGSPRKGFARHTFVGGNFFMLELLNKFRGELGVIAQSQDLEASVRRTVANLQTATGAVSIERAGVEAGRLNVDVAVRNLTGHKLPTGYPSRRVWLHVTVRDRNGKAVFESGAMAPDGSIQGNDNDTDGTRVEPHHAEVRDGDQVQIYESVMADRSGIATTGLLSAVRYLKDNRLLPRGFNKATAEGRIATVGAAADDADFSDGGDRVRYSVLAAGEGPFQIEAELRFQVVSFRWAENLRSYDTPETHRFAGYYQSMSNVSSQILSRASASVP